MDPRGKTAVITGASRGLGAGLAAAFAEAGLQLGLCARARPALPEGARGHTASVDVCDAAALEHFAGEVVERFGSIDLWINNAGLLEPIAPLQLAEPAAFAELIRVNVLGVAHGTRAFLRTLRGPAVLINISSGAARNAYAGWSAYCASKAAVDRMTECVQLEEAASGLRAYSVAPGVIDTAMQASIRRTPRSRFPALDKFVEIERSGRYNSPAFVARSLLAIAFEPSARPSTVQVSLPNEADALGR